MVKGSNHHCQWPRVSNGIIWCSFTDLERMEGWDGLGAWGHRKICCYDHHGELNPSCSNRSTMVYPLCYCCSKLDVTEMNGWKWNILKSRNFTNRKVLNFYQGNNENANTLLIPKMEHLTSHIMRRNQNWWFWNKNIPFVPKSSYLFLISDHLS